MPLNPTPWTDVYNKLGPPIRLHKEKAIFVTVLLMLVILGTLSSLWQGRITAFIFAEQLQIMTLNNSFNESTTIDLNISTINSLRASGTLQNGIARIYHQDLNNSLSLIFDSEFLPREIDNVTNITRPLVFNDVCVETCNLEMSGAKLLVVLRGENASLQLSNITYAASIPPGIITQLQIPDINLTNSTTINLSTYFTESNNHPLMYTVQVPESVRAVLFDDLLFLSERDAGLFNATVTASNGAMNSTNSFLIYVAGQNLSLNETINERTNARKVDVDEKIVEEFLKHKKVPVIILLKKPVSQQTVNVVDKKVLLEQKKSEIDVVQDSVINDVKQNENKNKQNSVNIITGAQVVDLQNVSNSAFVVTKAYDTVSAIAAEISPEELEVLKQNPNVEAVIYDLVLNITLQDAVPLISANDTHLLSTIANETITGVGQSVCVVDTGIDYTHPAIAGKTIGGIDFVNNDADAMDDNSVSHGTHVSGIVLGVAPNVKIVPVKVCDSAGSCTASNILAGIDYCTNRSIELNISVISGSLGDGGQYDATNCPNWFDSALATADSFGIVNVFASGNNGYLNGVSYPSCSLYSISVGASDKSDNIAGFTNRGTRLDVLAPGLAINSTVRGGGYGTLSGTSMATPFVSGTVALLKQTAKAQQQIINLNETKQILKNTGVAVSSWQRINVLNAVKNILQVISHPALVLISNNYDGENWTVVFNSSAGELKVLPAGGIILREVPDNNLTLDDADFVSLQNKDGVVNVTLVDSSNNTLPYSVYVIKKRVEQIVKRLGELG